MAQRKQEQEQLADRLDEVTKAVEQSADSAEAAVAKPETKQKHTCLTTLYVDGNLYLPGEVVELTDEQVQLAAAGSIAPKAVS